jgi:hypothetical protein
LNGDALHGRLGLSRRRSRSDGFAIGIVASPNLTELTKRSAAPLLVPLLRMPLGCGMLESGRIQHSSGILRSGTKFTVRLRIPLRAGVYFDLAIFLAGNYVKVPFSIEWDFLFLGRFRLGVRGIASHEVMPSAGESLGGIFHF